MKFSQKLAIIVPISLVYLMSVTPAIAAAPDGLGPWADSVFSVHQGLMKNGGSVPAIRSNPLATLGVAENDTIASHFYALGFGGNIVLGFDNGISNGAMLVEATDPGSPLEKAKVEMSQDGVTWMLAGNVNETGSVNQPEGIVCAKYVRITDTSDPAIFSDPLSDGYDVDGVKATGTVCNPSPSPVPSLIPSATPTVTPLFTPATPTPTTAPSSAASNTSATTTSNDPGACTSTGITTIPSIILAKRLSPTSIVVNWGPFAGLHDFIVHYGYVNGTWLFSTKVSGFSTTINDLPANQSIWIQVAGTDNCVVGTYGTAVLVGGTTATNTPGFPNTGTPGLPNTGFAPRANTTNGLFLLIVGFSVTTLVYLIKKVRIIH